MSFPNKSQSGSPLPNNNNSNTNNSNSPIINTNIIINNINSNMNNSINTNINNVNSRSSTPNSITSQQSQNTRNINSKDYLSILSENEALKLEISKLKNIGPNIDIINIYNKKIKELQYYINECNKYKLEYEKLKKKKEEQDKLVKDERKKKRKFIHILYDFGCSNQIIRQTMGNFEYSAEIRRYKVTEATKLPWKREVYYLKDNISMGYKEVQFTNSSDLSLNISDLSLIDINNNKLIISCKISKLNSSFGCIYEDNHLNFNNLNDSSSLNKFNSKQSYNSRRVSSKNNFRYWDTNNNNNNNNNYSGNNNNINIIRPDDHFLICFEHPIVKKVGIYKLEYRLFSQVKANTYRYKGNGAFGQKIEFEYQIKN